MSQTSSQTNATHGQSLPAGTHLEEFVIERVLGVGGFGITYLAKDSSLGRQVVIKENLPAQFCWRDTHALTVRPRHTEGEDADNFSYSLESFRKEASTLASLDHPGIVKVLRSFEAHGTAYFVMPFVEGTALDEVIRQRTSQSNPFTEAEIQDLLTKVLDALSHLHDRGIYHRDIKPGNILMTKAGPVLIDFGAARQRLSERSLTVIESAGYTPFEQLQSHGKIGPWSDIYALGGTLYKAITGETPAKATDRVFDDPIVSLAQRGELRGRYAHALLASIDKALSPKSGDRFQDAGQWCGSAKAAPVPMIRKPETHGTPTVPHSAPPTPQSQKDVSVSLHDQHQRIIIEASSAIARNDAAAVYSLCKLLENKRFTDLDYSPLKSFVVKRKERTLHFVVLAVMILGGGLLMQISGSKEIAQAEHQQRWVTAQAERERLLEEAEKKKLAAANDFNTAQIGDTRVVDLGSGVKLTLCYIPAGSFTMGSPASETDRSNDEDQVQVRITKGYWLAKTECTQTQWRAVMGTEPSHFKGDELSLESVSWEDAQAFMAKLKDKNVLPAGWKWSLPSEAQWEYACRAGTTGPYAGELDRMAWYSDNSGSTTHAVGTKAGNAWGLHDMHGNVYEWCSDWYDTKLPGGADPTGAASGSTRVFRGGSWSLYGLTCRSAYRSRNDPGSRNYNLGFRAASVPAER